MVVLIGLNEEVASIFKYCQGEEFNYVTVYTDESQLVGPNQTVVFLLDGHHKRRDWRKLKKSILKNNCICFEYRGIQF